MKKTFKRALGILLAWVMLLSGLPIPVLAETVSNIDEMTVQQQNEENKTTNVLDQVTPEKFFELIKGENTAMDQITGNLVDLGETVEKYGAGERMAFNFKEGALEYTETRGEVYCKWVSSSQPEYIDVRKNPRGLDLRKRPKPGEEPAEVVLTLSVWSANAAEREMRLPLKILPGEAIPSDFEIIQEKLFETIKGNNTDASQVKENMTIPKATLSNGLVTAYLRLGRDHVLSFGSKYVPTPNYMLTFGESSNNQVASVTTEGIIIKPQAQDTTVSIPVNVFKYYASKPQEQVGTFDLTFTVKALEGEVSGIFNQLTEEMLFTAIQGQNTSKDSVDQDFELKANGYNPLYIKEIKENGQIVWWSNKNNTLAKVHISKSSKPEIVEVGEDKVLLKERPQQDTPVELTFTVTDLKTGMTQDIPVHLLIKGKGTIQSDLFTPVKDGLGEAIRGANSDVTQIKDDLSFPGDCNPFYATVEGNQVTWNGEKSEKSNVKIRLVDTDHPELMAVEDRKIKVIQRPEEDTTVTLKVELLDLTKENSTPESFELQVVMPAVTPVEKELKSYLDQYLKAEYYQYTTIQKEGVDFQTDYAAGQVRYSMKLPNISSEEQLPYGEVKTSVTAKDSNVIKKVNNYVWEPIRADVGKEARTAVLTYTLTKNGESVSKDIEIGIPALTQQEIDEEISLLEEIKTDFFDGIKGKNYDCDNVSDSLVNLSEIRMEGGKIVWSEGAKDNRYHGFKFSTGTQFGSWEVSYEMGHGDIFDATNMVLQKRPKVDTKVRVGHAVESVQLQKYAELYPDNTSLQKIKRQVVYTDLTVKKVNSNLKEIHFGTQTVNVRTEQKNYTWLTDQTEDQMLIKAIPENKSARLVINGYDCTGIHQQEVILDQGFARFGINVSDCDNKNAGTEQSCDYTVTIVSRPYLENGAASLPDNPNTATKDEREFGQKLYLQYNALTPSEQATVKGGEKLKAYGQDVGYEQTAMAQIKEVEAQLFEGIRGQNQSADAVWTDLNEVQYAKVTDEGVQFYKNPQDGCNIRIKWISSSAPEYVDIHNGNDFETGYVNAFLLRKRPDREGHDLPVIFKAELTQMTEGVSEKTETQFNLKAYNARLSKLSVQEFELDFEPDTMNYTLFNTEGKPQLTMSMATVIPGAEITINGQKINEQTDIPLNQEITTVEIKVNDGIRNTLNEKWDERIYKITVLSSVTGLEAEILKLPEADTITAENFQNWAPIVNRLNKAYEGLKEDQKAQISDLAKNRLREVSEKINALKLEAVKADAVQEINEYGGSETEYTPRNWKKVIAARDEALKAIEKAQSAEAVIAALTEGKAAIMAVPKKDYGEAAVNTDLEQVFVMPGSVKAIADETGCYRVKMPADSKAIAVKALPVNKKAYVKVNGEEILPENDWTSKQAVQLETEGPTEVSITVVSSDESVHKDYRLLIEREAVVPEKQIEVCFELIGDQKHDEGMHQDFEVWIANTTIKVPEGTSVKDLTDKLLMEHQIPFETTGGNYIRSINGLAEMDNGPRSGWVYQVNEQRPGVTYDAYELKEGDRVLWRYTDDYVEDGLFHSDEEAAATVRVMIAALPDKDQLTLDHKASVQKTQKAFDRLSEGAKALLTTEEKTKLQEASDRMAVLEKNAADQQAAQQVIDQIDHLGEIVSLDQKPMVEAARKAYDALSDDQKVWVTNEDRLKEAEAKIAELEQAGETLPQGSDTSQNSGSGSDSTPNDGQQTIQNNVKTGLFGKFSGTSVMMVGSVLILLGAAVLLRRLQKKD